MFKGLTERFHRDSAPVDTNRISLLTGDQNNFIAAMLYATLALPTARVYL
jgi:hypothetical protein